MKGQMRGAQLLEYKLSFYSGTHSSKFDIGLKSCAKSFQNNKKQVLYW